MTKPSTDPPRSGSGGSEGASLSRTLAACLTTPAGIVSALTLGIVLVVLLSLAGATLSHERAVLRGSQIGPAYPPVLYGLMPSPGTSPMRGAPGAAGADFAQVYTSASALRHGESAYFPTTPEFKDRFGRPAGYPPLTNWLYVPLSRLPYYDALIAHIAFWLVATWASSALILWTMGLGHHAPGVLLAQGALYVLTPIGFTHVERGQFDLVVAIASALCVACVYVPRRAPWLATLSGVLGTLKWTSAVFLGCFCVVGVVLAPRRRRWVFALIPLLMIAGTVVFWRSIPEYWHTIRVFEIDARSGGVTFTHLVPRAVAKLLPVAVTFVLGATALFVARASERRRQQMLFATSAPLSMLLMNMAVCYGTVSYEYHTVATLGLLPGLAVWIEREPIVPLWVKGLTAAAFGVFECLAFRTFQYSDPFDSLWMTWVYATFAGLFFALCGYIVMGPVRAFFRGRAPAHDPGEGSAAAVADAA